MPGRRPRGSAVLTDALREIRKTLSRFLSIFVLAALAVAFLAGLRTTSPTMEYTADRYFDDQHLMDVHVLSTLGITEEDVDALAAAPGVALAEGAYTVDALARFAGGDHVVKVCTLSEHINVPSLTGGRLPREAGECLADSRLLARAGLSIGDTITLDTGDGDYQDALARTSFTVVGAADSPLYVSTDRGSSTLGGGKVEGFLLLLPEAFSMDSYTDAYLLAEDTEDLLCYGDAYEDRMDLLTGALEPLGEERANLRTEEIIGEAQAELSDARKELEEAEEEVARELSDALAQLEEGEEEYAQGLADLEEGRRAYWDGLAQWEDGSLQYDRGYGDLLEGEESFQEGLEELEEAEADYADGVAALQEGIAALYDGSRELAQAEDELEEAARQLAEGAFALAQGQSQLEAARTQLTASQLQFDTLLSGVWMAAVMADPTAPIAAAEDLLQPGAALTDPQSLAAAAGVLTPALTQIEGQISLLEAAGTGPGDSTYDTLIAQRDGLKAVIAAATGALPQEPDEENPDGENPDGEEPGGEELNGENPGGDSPEGEDPGGEVPGTINPWAITGYLQAQKAELDEGWAQLAAGEARLEAAAEELWWGQEQYNTGLAQYRAGVEAYLEGVQELLEAQETLAQGRLDLDEGWREAFVGRQELDDAWAALAEARAELDNGLTELTDAWAELRDGEAELADARTELDEGWEEYRQGEADLAEARERFPREIADAEAELNDGEAELRDGEAEYADGLREYEEGRAEAEEELSDARAELADAQAEVDSLEECTWYILDRNTNVGYVAYGQEAQRMDNLATVFPLIFFLVAALVCLTNMTRMVEEQRVQIGTLKALGYGRGAIALKYVGYGLLASLLGGGLGLALGGPLIPAFIYSAWTSMYTLGDTVIPFLPAVGLTALLAAAACVTGAALAASFAALRAVPAQLMRPRAPRAGRRVLLERIRPLWRRLTFTYKVTVRNLFRYKKRFWMTVMGIGGCTALIVAAFGLRDSILAIQDIQYGQIFTYSLQVTLEDGLTEEDRGAIRQALEESEGAEDWLFCRMATVTAEGERRSVDATLVAAEDPEALASFITLRHRTDGEAVSLPAEGAVLSEKLAALLNVQAGDTVTLDGETRAPAAVADTTEQYVMHYLYLTAGAYEAAFGAPPEENALLIRCPEGGTAADDLSAELLSLPGVVSVARVQDDRDTLRQSTESVNYAVVLITVCAAALAFVVLYNLSSINITERLRELATLKVLGFYEGELAAYVNRENVFLTIFGMVLGLGMGKFLHRWLVLTVEVDMFMFGRSAALSSYLIAVVLTSLFSLVINLGARRRLRGIDMVESLKTLE